MRDGFTNAKTTIDGGILYRFGIVVDCGKCFPRARPSPWFRPELVRVCEHILGCAFVEAGVFY